MRYIKFTSILLLFIALMASTQFHKYYISVTQIEYVADKKAVQIISRIFTDDLEKVLQERYDENIDFDSEDTQEVDAYIKKYIGSKLKIKINNKDAEIQFVGKVNNIDILKCYLEIENVEHIDTFEISNKILLDLFSDQQNVIKLNINAKKKSFVLTAQNNEAVLNFN